MAERIETPRRSRDARPVARRRGRFGIRRAVGRGGFQWRWISGLIVLLLTGTGIFIFTSPMFYVHQAEVGGVRYVPAEEVFTAAEIAELHVLWVDPDEVAKRVAASPSLESAQVFVGWPARVVILVQEREPALIWEQGGQRYWVDVNGNLMLMRRELPGLLRIVNEGEAIPFHCPGPGCTEENTVTIDLAVVQGAQQLKTLRSNIDVLYYDPVRGLSYQDGRGWRGYFGTGTDMNLKLVVYETLVDDLMARGIQPVYIDVSNPDAPFYRAAR
ncbi:MAG TPA: FtsQ-type POTRA domain-containing protein [Chloroflexi bacterium]|nr:FtsQ-type POTRA domain-containing protein [Chloroflexota bacterium]